ncbi:Voltage-dependent calcium channel subunit alpha-2/delta-4 [Gracilariopsis chorda]|uniref:Voltage-dependent calcium channel subunit alpha-2/delta-4 n=1 Tax=Gracilariopsis chorda TaxID=448386 RepID=A0A2V3IZF3_9FLOR|nr:Voltage-dependent calcium channel subunit alpha-2/delta-4 [Gracilariopsis chorda]|eukprot:PXF47469.1 Voltage-dependent calcium channel subunit alpha-2/delta-4 [Gracilariopsis chorda]
MNRRRSPHSRALALHIVLLVSIFHALHADNFDEFIAQKAGAARKVANKLSRVLAPSALCRAPVNCNDGACLPHGCSNSEFGPNYRCANMSTDIVCDASCEPNKRLLTRDTPEVRSPSGTVRYAGRRGKDIVFDDLDLRRQACALKDMTRDLRRAYVDEQLQSWIYAATSSGLHLAYPGKARSRPDNRLETCGFVPMQRPWYIAAASGRRDIVFLFDTSLSTADKVLPRALKSALATLDTGDYVSVIAFGDTSVTVLGNTRTLRKAESNFTSRLEQEVESLPQSSGFPMMTEAFTKAFEILSRSERESQTSNCARFIALLSKDAPKCFENCRQDSADECTCTNQIVSLIKSKQQDLRSKVSIVSFTEGDDNDAQRVARSIVCEAEGAGVWRQVSSTESAESALIPLSDIASLSQRNTEYTSGVYTDASGLGEMFTIARPAYDARSSVILGVVGVDVTIREAVEVVGNEGTVRSRVAERHQRDRGCEQNDVTSGQRQSLRLRYEGVCADILRSWSCYRVGGSLFIPSNGTLSWNEARGYCRSLGNGSDLAILDNEGKNKMAAAITSYDGNWIGLRATQGNPLQWVSGTAWTTNSYGFYKGIDVEKEIENIHNTENVNVCISVDRRGIKGNWNIVPCDAKRTAICELQWGSPAAVDHCSSNIFDPRTTSHTPVNEDVESSNGFNCEASDDEALQNANPICKEKTKDKLRDFDRLCCGGRADSSGPLTCDSTSESSNVGVIAGSVVGALAVVTLIVILLLLWRRKRKKTPNVVPVDKASQLNESENATNVGISPEPSENPPPDGSYSGRLGTGSIFAMQYGHAEGSEHQEQPGLHRQGSSGSSGERSDEFDGI